MAQTFNSIEEELNYWKSYAQRVTEEKDSIQREYEDYTADSQQLEKEYEITIDQHERTIREIKSLNNSLQNKVESLQVKLDQSNKDNDVLQSDISSLQEGRETLRQYIRELEQKNDDLERAQRVVTETVEAIETSLNSALERNAILESEIDEKEGLKERLQRLADETRDLKQELLVREKEHIPDNERAMNGHVTTPLLDLNRLRIENETQTPIKTDPHISLKNVDINALNAPLSPASRLLAMNIVGDIMRKVGSLETKLGRCRNCGFNNYKPENNIRNHRSTRGSSPSIQGFAK